MASREPEHDEELARLDGNPWQRVLDLQLSQLENLRGDITAARAARDEAIALIRDLQHVYAVSEARCARF